MILSSYYGYKNANYMWNGNKKYNESVVDLKQGKYNLLAGFILEDKTKYKKGQKKPYNESMIHIVPIAAIVGVLISFLLAKISKLFAVPDLRIFFLPLLFIYPGLGFLSVTMQPLYNFNKIRYYEKLIGKPIKNGISEFNKDAVDEDDEFIVYEVSDENTLTLVEDEEIIKEVLKVEDGK